MTASDGAADDTALSRPYGDAAMSYLATKLGGPLPLPPKRKKDPPVGWTGWHGLYPSGPDVAAWAETKAGGNICLRLADGVLGIDVDAYDGKDGHRTLERLEATLGPLPPTVRSTSRGDGVSGIRLYRVPPGMAWAGVITARHDDDEETKGIETVHLGHRYAVCWPSVHPNGSTYRWLDGDAGGMDRLPTLVEDVPELPVAWVDYLKRGTAQNASASAELTDEQTRTWLGDLDDRGACERVRLLRQQVADAIAGDSRHDSVLVGTLRLLRAGEQQHRGVPVSLALARAAFITAVTADGSRSDGEAAAEWDRMLIGGVAKIAATPSGDDVTGCVCLDAWEGRVNTETGEVQPPGRGGSRRPAQQEAAGTALVHLALGDYRLGISTDGDPFTVPLKGPQIVRQLRGGKSSLRAALANTYFVSTGKVAPQQALTEALLTLEGRAQQQDGERLHLRVAQQDGTHYLDLGDPTGRVVAITAAGWQVLEHNPVLFRRTQLTGALPEPRAEGTLDDLWRLLNVAVADRPLVLAWLVAALLPDVPHPVLVLRGEQGSGKSTATRTLAALLDPSPAQVRKPPRDVDAWVTSASGSWVVGIDNVSTVPEWWSDSLCRAVTGDGDARRRLYSDADLAVFSFRRVVLLNGIDLGSVRDDLAERLLTVELHRIGERGRWRDQDLAAQWEDAHPRILAALLNLACQVLDTLPRLHLERLPRMADFALVLAAVDHALGTNGFDAYVGQAGDLAADAVDSDPVLSAITAAIREPWTGPAAELLDLINAPQEDHRRPRGWPKDPRELTGLLRRRAPALRGVGWTVEDLGRRGRLKVVHHALTPPAAGDRRATAGDAGDSASAAGDETTRRPHGCEPLTSDDAKTGPAAGDAGDKTGPSLPRWLRKEEERPPEAAADSPVRDAPGASPASPASPAHIGPCGDCGASTVRYGPTGGSWCHSCVGDLERDASGLRAVQP